MLSDPKDKRRFQFTELGDGMGSVHKVIDISQGQITTLTVDELDDEQSEATIWSWMGNDKDFFNQFKRLK